jgi:hypothetical protein
MPNNRQRQRYNISLRLIYNKKAGLVTPAIIINVILFPG